jgi:hypothetical protein
VIIDLNIARVCYRVQVKSTDGHVFEPANIDYPLSFADQGKQTSVFCFRLQQTNGSCCLYFYTNTHIHIAHIYIYTCIYTYIYIYAVIPNGKLKPRRFSLILLPFAHRANGSLTFICLLTKKQTEVICLQAY